MIPCTHATSPMCLKQCACVYSFLRLARARVRSESAAQDIYCGNEGIGPAICESALSACCWSRWRAGADLCFAFFLYVYYVSVRVLRIGT